MIKIFLQFMGIIFEIVLSFIEKDFTEKFKI